MMMQPNPLKPDDLVAGLREARLLAVIRGNDADASIAAALALAEEGVKYLEIAITTPDALRVIETVCEHAGPDVVVGAGTVLTVDDVAAVLGAGAQFILTPSLAPSVAEAAERGVPVIAGAFTPSECYRGMELGASAIKLFPASAGGPDYLKAVRDPFPDIPFIAIGGVGQAEATEYWRRGALAVGVGGPLVGDAASGGNLAELRSRARAYLQLAADSRG